MSDWLTDPQLFLYATGTGPDDVVLRRCKKPVSSSSSSLVVPMKSDDFDYVSNVENHLELIGDLFDWDETDYKRLVKYIYERLLLVNRQGLVIAEIYKLDDVNEVPIYIRLLDVLPLKPYIPNIRERLIPLRTVKYLEDVNGKAAMMEEKDSNVITELTARVDDLEIKNKTLDTTVTKLTASLATTKGENKTLDSNVKTMEGKVTKLTADLATALNTLGTLQRELKENPYYVWMNYLTHTDWVGLEKLSTHVRDKITIIRQKGTFTKDNNNDTNVRASCCYTVKLDAYTAEFMTVSLEDLTPNKEMARFLPLAWFCNTFQGKTYICRGVPSS